MLSVGVIIGLTNCGSSKYLKKNEYLLSKNTIIENGNLLKDKEVYNLIKQKVNKKIWGITPLYLHIYNLGNKNKNHFLKKIGEPPVIFKNSLANKSKNQIKLYYKKSGFFDTEVDINTVIKKHKISSTYLINTGSNYRVNKFELDKKNNSSIAKLIREILKESTIKIGKAYELSEIEIERNRIATKLQNEGYYKFNKEYLYFIADTSQKEKHVDLILMIKQPSNEELKEEFNQHKKGIIRNIYVHKITPDKTIIDTSLVNGIYFISNKKKFNINRIIEKIFIHPDQVFNKKLVDKSYQALSELKHFKKIAFEFIKSSSDSLDNLDGHIYLTIGKKIAYSLEAEISTNPELNEGISGAASINHYDLFKGGENLSLTLVKSKTLNKINENGFVLNFSFPNLISPLSTNRYKNTETKTSFSISFKEQDRVEFNRKTLKADYNYEWKRKNKYLHHLSLINISYVNFEEGSLSLNNISEYLISTDYSDQLIPASSYTLTFNNQNINKLKNHSFFRLHIETSGNLMRNLVEPLGLNKLKDDQGNDIIQSNGNPIYTVNLLNNQNIFSQYIKTDIDYRYYIEINSEQNIAIRSMAGIIYAYGNTSQAPFHKKFIAGGSNDLRGWQAFKRPTGGLNYTDSLYTGGLKLLSSIEYRFKLIQQLKGAFFLDAGNIWEIKKNNSKNFEEANFRWNTFLNQIALNVGFGIRYDFNYFIIRTDFGFPIRENIEIENSHWKRLNFKNSQFNIGLGYPF